MEQLLETVRERGFASASLAEDLVNEILYLRRKLAEATR